MPKDISARILLVVASILVGLVLIEGLLNIYNPFPFRMKGDDIVLPQHFHNKIENKRFSRLAPVIVHTKNSMGFRGPEWPEDGKNHSTIFAVG